MRPPYWLDVLTNGELSTKATFQEIKYWYVTRQTRKFIPWLATKLPQKLKYYVVIHGMVKVEPNSSPEKVTGIQMLELWKEKAEA